MTTEPRPILVTLGGECFEVEFEGKQRAQDQDADFYLFHIRDLKAGRGTRLVRLVRFGPKRAVAQDYDARLENVRLNTIRRAVDSGAFSFEDPYDEQRYKEIPLTTTDFRAQSPASDTEYRRYAIARPELFDRVIKTWDKVAALPPSSAFEEFGRWGQEEKGYCVSAFGYNLKIHRDFIGGRDSNDPNCLYKAYNRARNSLRLFKEGSPNPKRFPWWFWVFHVSAVASWVGAAGLLAYWLVSLLSISLTIGTRF